MKPETAAALDDLEMIAKGINEAIENVAISGIPCKLISSYKGENDKMLHDIIQSKTLTKLLVNGLSAELRMIEGYVLRRNKRGEVDSDTALEIVTRIEQIRKLM